MSIYKNGLAANQNLAIANSIAIQVPAAHPLLSLMRSIPWERIATVVEKDLWKTPRGKPWRGRQLFLRGHLGVFCLQKLKNWTDREAEYQVKDNAACRIFCGYFGPEILRRPPDHTKIEDFRSRLEPETQRQINDVILRKARDLGFADPRMMDIDSTVQEANMAYPSDVNLLVKACGLAQKVKKFIESKLPIATELGNKCKEVMKKIKGLAKEYLFKKGDGENILAEKRRIAEEILEGTRQEVGSLIGASIHPKDVNRLPWNIRRAYLQLQKHWDRFATGVYHFLKLSKALPGKPLSFFLEQIAFFDKGKKAGKKMQIGRQYQLGRVGGNFLVVAPSTDVRMEDKSAVKPVVELHAKVFGAGTLESVGTDKGYYKSVNLRYLAGVESLKEMCIQMPGFSVEKFQAQDQKETYQRLVDRRAGIEPLIGHAKHGGQLGKSRMKTDAATLAAGYGAVLGLNLRQLTRHVIGKKIEAMG